MKWIKRINRLLVFRSETEGVGKGRDVRELPDYVFNSIIKWPNSKEFI